MPHLLTLTLFVVSASFLPLIWSTPAKSSENGNSNSTKVDEKLCPCGDTCRNNTDGAITCAVELKTKKPICIVACCLPGFCGKNCTMPGGYCCSDLKISLDCDEPIDYSEFSEWDFDPADFEFQQQ